MARLSLSARCPVPVCCEGISERSIISDNHKRNTSRTIGTGSQRYEDERRVLLLLNIVWYEHINTHWGGCFHLSKMIFLFPTSVLECLARQNSNRYDSIRIYNF
ncbi:hypothetical protein WAI453_011715 [Rhynchosporium graminicola]